MPTPAQMLLMAGGGATAFTPTSLSGLYAWYDASDTSSITDAGSGAMSQWNDKSGHSYHLTQGTGSARPHTGTRTMNSLNVADFDGGDVMVFTPFTVSFSISNYTIFIVAGQDTNTINTGLVSLHSSTGSDFGDANNLSLECSNNSLQAAHNSGIAGVFATGAGATAIGTWTIWRDSANVGGQVNIRDPAGTSGSTADVATGATGTAAGSGIIIGGRWSSGAVSGTDRTDGPVGEVIIYSVALSSTDRTTVRNYLIAKWGA